MTRAKVIADSINENGNRLTTLEVVMHRFVLAEFNTHRAFSRNSASSRAIPVEKQLKKIMETPAIPISWGKNQKGMQAEAELDLSAQALAEKCWLNARDKAVESANLLREIGVHKQITNRLLEPFMFQTAIVSFTDFANFESQRCSPLAQPEIQVVAYDMRDCMRESVPTLIDFGGWHLPYINEQEFQENDLETLKKVSVARCARVSYLTHDGIRDLAEDIKMFDRLISASPPHYSPLEHVATPVLNLSDNLGNFKGWTQLRHQIFSY